MTWEEHGSRREAQPARRVTGTLCLQTTFSSLRRTQVFTRSAKLFAIGLFLNNGARLSEWRILGVLQCVELCDGDA